MVVARTSHHQGLVSRTSARGRSSSATDMEGTTTTPPPTRTRYFAYFAFCICCIFYFIFCTLSSGATTTRPPTRTGWPPSTGTGCSRSRSHRLSRRATWGRESQDVWSACAGLQRQCWRLVLARQDLTAGLEVRERYTLHSGRSWTFTKLYPPKSLFLNTSDPQILRCLQLYSTSFSEKAHNLIVEYQTFCVWRKNLKNH